jgi:hypothetical protein
MRRLAGASELLDGALDDPAALRGNLRDLARINRALGGTAASRRALDGLVRGRTVPHTMLDVGTGGADIPLDLLVNAGHRGRALRVTGVDSRAAVLDAAHAIEPRLGTTRGLELVLADGRSLPWPDRSFDIVHASLLIHHLEPPEAIQFLREAARVARIGVIVNDLVRARHHWLAARLLLGVTTRNRYTRHDGPLSVQRAYTRVELRALLAGAALRPVHEVSALLGHRIAIAAVPMRELEERRRPNGGDDSVPGATPASAPSPGTRADTSDRG